MDSVINKTRLFLLFIIAVSVFALFLPNISLAGTVYYTTECGETFSIGSYSNKYCRTCCGEYSCWPCCPCCDQYSCSGEWQEYKASTSGCDPNILIRTCRSVCGPAVNCCGCGACQVVCDDWEICEDCGSWQKAERPGCEVTKWGLTKPRCVCNGCGDGKCCVAAPTGLRYYNNPNYPTDPCSPEAGVGPTKIKLPVKLDWDDVEGWKDGWCGGGGYQITDNCGSMTTVSSSPTTPWRQCANRKSEECIESAIAAIPQEDWDAMNYCQKRSRMAGIKSSCAYQQYITECVKNPDPDPTPDPDPDPDDECNTGECPYPNLVYELSELVQFYEIIITGEMRDKDGNAIPSFGPIRLDQSEFIPPHPCFFKSNREYKWKVRACCGNGDCGPWSEEKTFTTNLAPEPVWPYDPDWAGPDRAEPHWKTPTEDEFLPVHLEWCPVDEAKSYCLRFYKEGKPFCPDLISDLPCPAVIPPSKEFSIQSYFGFGLDVFTKETNYQWKVATCLSEEDVGLQCGLGCPEDKICYTFETLEFECPCCDFSQLWRFFGRTTLSAPKLIFPENGSCVNFTHNLEWGYVSGANSYRYEIYKINGGPSLLVNEPTKANLVSARDLGDKGILNIDENYAWRVQPCWDEKGTDCENDSWSNEGLLWEFTTTGATPTGLDVAEKDPNNYALIPIKLNWDDMPCAASYRYKVNGPDGIIAEGLIIGTGVPPSEISINYDSDIEHPKQGTFYSWEVWTCADKEGNICGNPDSASFTTFELDAPENRHPPDGENFYTNERYLKWKVVLGAAYYKYEIDGETNIVSLNYGSVDTWKLALGRHNWSVWACIDRDCKEMGPPSTWSFELVEGEAPAGKGGIVPCGKYTDNPNTPWNERLPCGIEHIFIMIYLIIEFVLWKLIPIALVLLVLASGVIFYFSGQLGVPDPISRVKSLWKAIGIGLAVVFLAWTGISLILGLFGYQVGIFGDWWRIF